MSIHNLINSINPANECTINSYKGTKRSNNINNSIIENNLLVKDLNIAENKSKH